MSSCNFFHGHLHDVPEANVHVCKTKRKMYVYLESYFLLNNLHKHLFRTFHWGAKLIIATNSLDCVALLQVSLEEFYVDTPDHDVRFDGAAPFYI